MSDEMRTFFANITGEDLDNILDAQIAASAETVAPVDPRDAEIKRLREALDRLGSMEAFTVSRPIHPNIDGELLARIDYARRALEAKP